MLVPAPDEHQENPPHNHSGKVCAYDGPPSSHQESPPHNHREKSVHTMDLHHHTRKAHHTTTEKSLCIRWTSIITLGKPTTQPQRKVCAYDGPPSSHQESPPHNHREKSVHTMDSHHHRHTRKTRHTTTVGKSVHTMDSHHHRHTRKTRHTTTVGKSVHTMDSHHHRHTRKTRHTTTVGKSVHTMDPHHHDTHSTSSPDIEKNTNYELSNRMSASTTIYYPSNQWLISDDCSFRQRNTTHPTQDSSTQQIKTLTQHKTTRPSTKLFQIQTKHKQQCHDDGVSVLCRHHSLFPQEHRSHFASNDNTHTQT